MKWWHDFDVICAGVVLVQLFITLNFADRALKAYVNSKKEKT
jgi:hypothetical protein